MKSIENKVRKLLNKEREEVLKFYIKKIENPILNLSPLIYGVENNLEDLNYAGVTSSIYDKRRK
jgi:hypothetical protein